MARTTSRGEGPRGERPERDDDAQIYISSDRVVAADGGRPELEPGERAVDREDSDEAVVVVVFVHDTAAGDYTIEALGETVAGVNPGYSARDHVVKAVYLEAAEAALSEWADVSQLRVAVAFDWVRSYSFPESRLRSLDEDLPDDPTEAVRRSIEPEGDRSGGDEW